MTEAAQQLYNTSVVVTVHERVKEHLQAGISEHVVFLVKQVGRNVDTLMASPSACKIIAPAVAETRETEVLFHFYSLCMGYGSPLCRLRIANENKHYRALRH